MKAKRTIHRKPKQSADTASNVSLKWRAILSVIILMISIVLSAVFSTAAGTFQSNISTSQLANSDSGYVAAQTAILFYGLMGKGVFFATLGSLAWIWYKPVKTLVQVLRETS